MIRVTFTTAQGDKTVQQYQDSTHPFRIFYSLYKDNRLSSWEIDFTTVPEKLYYSWRKEDDYWKFFIPLSHGISVIIGSCLYRTDSKDSKIISKSVYGIWGRIAARMETNNDEHFLIKIDGAIIVFFEDQFEQCLKSAD